jgi:hypothetical protein
MLYFYKPTPAHQIENLHKYLDYFFVRLFGEVSLTYQHNIHIHPDFLECINEYTVQLDDKLRAIFDAYKLLKKRDKNKVKSAYQKNNDIAAVCKKSVAPIKYGELPLTIRTPIESLYDNLWGDNKILGYSKVVEKCGTLKQHFTNFRELNEFCVCPFCGLESLICKSDDGKDDYDHYLPKSKYPFISVNFNNLLPMCHKCNSKSKGQDDTPYSKNPIRQRTLYFPLDDNTPNHEIKINIDSQDYDLSNPITWKLNFLCKPSYNINKSQSWQEVFKVEKRYKSILADESHIWKGWIIEKHRKMCKKNKIDYSIFQEVTIDDFSDIFNMDKGILIDSFYKFVLNDPNCESYLTGNVIV